MTDDWFSILPDHAVFGLPRPELREVPLFVDLPTDGREFKTSPSTVDVDLSLVYLPAEPNIARESDPY